MRSYHGNYEDLEERQQNLYGPDDPGDKKEEGRYYGPFSQREEMDQRHRQKVRRKRLLAIAAVMFVLFFGGMLLTAGYNLYTLINGDRTDPPDWGSQGGETQMPSGKPDPAGPELVIRKTEYPDREAQLQYVEGEPLSVVQIASKVRPVVVGVVSTIYGNGYYGKASGSGIIMTSDGYIITNQHVIEGAAEILVVTENNEEYSAVIVGQDKKSDLAVLKVDGADLPYAEFGDSDAVLVGEIAVAIGNPLGLELASTVTAGIISGVNRALTIDDRELTLLQTDASINSGNSGGPLVNEYGMVIGINSVKIGQENVEGLGFAIPINQAKPIIDSLIKNGYVKDRPMIGISGTDVDEPTARYNGVPQGVRVGEINEDSGAGASDIRKGDIIIAVNGTTITSMSELNRQKDQFKAGDKLTLTIYRDGKTFDVEVVLTEQKP